MDHKIVDQLTLIDFLVAFGRVLQNLVAFGRIFRSLFGYTGDSINHLIDKTFDSHQEYTIATSPLAPARGTKNTDASAPVFLCHGTHVYWGTAPDPQPAAALFVPDAISYTTRASHVPNGNDRVFGTPASLLVYQMTQFALSTKSGHPLVTIGQQESDKSDFILWG